VNHCKHGATRYFALQHILGESMEDRLSHNQALLRNCVSRRNGRLRSSVCALLAGLLFALAWLTPAAKPADQDQGSAGAVRPASPEVATAPTRLKIILLKPAIRFEDVSGKPPRIGATEEEYGRRLTEAAMKGVGPKTTLIDVGMLDAPVRQACGELESLASRLARGDVNEEAAGELARLATFDDQYAVLVQFLRVKSGPMGSWSPINGQMTSSMSSTLVQAALVAGKTGKVIWKGEQFVRKKLKPADAGLSKALTLLYMDFDSKEGGQG
jgi:hypothetical protein